MLHAYELGQLDAERRDRFEVHLLACEHCFEQVSHFHDAAVLLRADPDVHDVIQSAVTAAASTEKEASFWARVRSHLWPDTSLVLKPAVMYFVIALLAYPAYLGIRGTADRPAQGVQSLLLTGTRSGSQGTVAAARPLVVMFRIDGAREGAFFGVRVRAETGDLVYQNERFEDFNDRQMATLLLPATSLSAGRYHIEVFGPTDERPLHQYEFVVE